jgi:hypothetical protein
VDVVEQRQADRGNRFVRGVALGYCVSGSMKIAMDDGSEQEISAGDVFAIPPGHDAEVTSDQACVLLDFGEISDYAKRA